MLKTILLLLLLTSLLLSCQPNTSKEEQLYQLLKQELINRDILLYGQNKDWHWLDFYSCYTVIDIPNQDQSKDVIRAARKQRKHPCTDSIHLSKMGYTPQQILAMIEPSNIPSLFVWQEKIQQSDRVLSILEENITVKEIKSKRYAVNQSDTFEFIKEEKHYKKSVVYWSAPYFFEDHTKAVVIEVGFEAPSSTADWRTYKNYVYQDNAWLLKQTIKIK